MLKPFSDHYTVTELQKMNKGTLKALVKFRSTNRRRKTISHLKLRANELFPWVEVPPEEDMHHPVALNFLANRSAPYRLRFFCNYMRKQKRLLNAVCAFLKLQFTHTDDDPFDVLRDTLRSQAWKPQRAPQAKNTKPGSARRPAKENSR